MRFRFALCEAGPTPWQTAVQHTQTMKPVIQALTLRQTIEAMVNATRIEYNDCGELRTRAVFIHAPLIVVTPDEGPPDSFRILPGKRWGDEAMRATAASELRKLAGLLSPVLAVFVIAQDLDGRCMAYCESEKGCWVGHAPVNADGNGIGEMKYRQATQSDPFYKILTPDSGKEGAK